MYTARTSRRWRSRSRDAHASARGGRGRRRRRRCAPADFLLRLLDRVRGALRARNYSARTEDSYVGWIWRFVVFLGKRHPAEWAHRRCPGS